MGELLFNVLLLLFFIAMGVYATDIRINEDTAMARTWPMVMIGAIAILLIVKIYKIWKALPQEERKFSFSIFKFHEKGVQKLLLAMVWIFLYITFMPTLGFALSTILFFAGMTWLIGARSVPVIALSAIGVTIAVWAVFVWGLDVFPPRGVGFLEDISIWLEYLI